MPHGRILAGGIWELRPSSDRLLFAAYLKNSFIILHHFTKAEVNNDKMLALAIAKAISNLYDYQKREGYNE